MHWQAALYGILSIASAIAAPWALISGEGWLRRRFRRHTSRQAHTRREAASHG